MQKDSGIDAKEASPLSPGTSAATFFKKYPRRWIFLSACLFLLFAFLAYAHFYESRALRTVYYEVTAADLPPAFDGFKIVLITDPHYGTPGSYDLLPATLDLTRRESPDLLLFGGDYTGTGCDYVESTRTCLAEFKKLNAPYGKFGVLGNHDYFPDPTVTLQIMETVGEITSLNDRGVWIEKDGQRIRVFGTEFLWDEEAPLQFPRYEVGRLAESDFVILLTHNPDDFERFSPEQKKKLDLVLAGHAHCGQITFFGIWSPISVIRHDKYRTGLVKTPTTTVIISNGIGTVRFPLRFFAPPQVVSVTLRSVREK